MSIGDSRDLPASERVYLELSDGQSHKFYEVVVNGTAVTIRYGRIGTTGQSSSSTYATPEKAQAEATKKINEKLRKGYVQVSPTGDRPTSSEQLLADPRHYWIYGNAWFISDGQGGWEEANEETRHQGHSWQFREMSRTEEYVELYDQSRRVTVRLTATSMLVRWDRDGINARWEEYHKGQWQEPSRDRPASESPTASETRLRATHLTELPSDLSQEPPSPAAAPPLPAIDPTIPAPSIDLLNQSPLFPPRVARNLLPNVKHSLGFSFRESGFCSLSIPLPRSIACIEIVGTFHDLAQGIFTIRLTANQDRETVCIYGFDFQPNHRLMMQWSAVAGMWREERLEFPSTIASGQVFQYVLVITAEGNIVFYLNNQPFSYSLQPSEPPDTLHLNYTPAGVKLQQVRVLETTTAKRQGSRSSPAVATPVPPLDQHPSTPQKTTDIPSFLEDLPSQFEPLRSFLQQNLVPYIRIQAGEQVGSMDFFNRGTGDPLTVWQSKIGGNPYFPKTAEYPIDPGTGKAMPLLMQINCAEVPPIAGFDFPQVGILQFYLGFQPAEASATPGKYRVLYFSEISTNPSDLITDFSFIERDETIREVYPEVYPITFSASRDLFWELRYGRDLDSPEELAELCEEFNEWIVDNIHEQRSSKLGGYGDADYFAPRVNSRLLLELIDPFSREDFFLFFISDEQLRDRDFKDAEFYFMC